jgi:hypothetical protein
MKVAEFSELGNIIEKFSKKGEKVASIVIPDDLVTADRLDITGSLAERVAAINRQNEDYLLKMAQKMGESFGAGIKKTAEANVPLDAIAAQAESASNAMQVPPDPGMVPPQASDALVEGGDQKTLDEVKDTAAAAVSAVASELAAVAESKGAIEGQSPPPVADGAPPMESADMGGIMPSGMGGKVASVIVPTKEEKEKTKVDKLAEAMVEGLGDESPLSEDIEGEDTTEEAIAMAEQIVSGMRRDEEGKVKPPATAIGESVDDKLVMQIAQSIISGGAEQGDAGAEVGHGDSGVGDTEASDVGDDGGLGEAALEEDGEGGGGEEAIEPEPEMDDEGSELDEAAIGDDDAEISPSESIIDDEGDPEVIPGEGGDPSEALIDEEQGGEGENSEDVDPATMAMLDSEEQEDEGEPGELGEEGIDPNDPEVMAAAAEIAKNMAEEEERKKVG